MPLSEEVCKNFASFNPPRLVTFEATPEATITVAVEAKNFIIGWPFKALLIIPEFDAVPSDSPSFIGKSLDVTPYPKFCIGPGSRINLTP